MDSWEQHGHLPRYWDWAHQEADWTSCRAWNWTKMMLTRTMTWTMTWRRAEWVRLASLECQRTMSWSCCLILDLSGRPCWKLRHSTFSSTALHSFAQLDSLNIVYSVPVPLLATRELSAHHWAQSAPLIWLWSCFEFELFSILRKENKKFYYASATCWKMTTDVDLLTSSCSCRYFARLRSSCSFFKRRL